jgi:Sap, sulfolipid-1-addressing protein
MAYVAGWVLALTAVAVATIALYPATPKVASSSPWTSWVQIAAGVAMGGWLLVRSRRRMATVSGSQEPGSQTPTSQPTGSQPPTSQAPTPQAPGSQPPGSLPPSSQPRWMSRLDSMSLLPAFVLGAFLPNYAVVVATVGNVVQAGLSQAWAAAVLVLFIVVASAGVAAPLLLLVFRPDDAPDAYQRWRVWLTENGQRLVKLVLAVVALVLMVKGIVGLVS